MDRLKRTDKGAQILLNLSVETNHNKVSVSAY